MPEWLADKSTFDIVSFVVGALGLIAGLAGLGFGYKQYCDQKKAQHELGSVNRWPTLLGASQECLHPTHWTLPV